MVRPGGKFNVEKAVGALVAAAAYRKFVPANPLADAGDEITGVAEGPTRIFKDTNALAEDVEFDAETKTDVVPPSNGVPVIS